MEFNKIATLPNLLTLARLILSPIMLPILFVAFLPYNYYILNAFLALVFLLFGLTDLLDGYYARKLEQVSVLGAMLDPIADKFLLYSSLIALLAANKIFFYWVIIFIGREFFVMGLRLIALEKNIYLHVSWLAKIKTAVEMLFITVAIYNPDKGNASWMYGWNKIEAVLLVAALGLTLTTAFLYYQEFFDRMRLRASDRIV